MSRCFLQLVSISFSICVATIAPTDAKSLELRVDVGETAAYRRECTAGSHTHELARPDVVMRFRNSQIFDDHLRWLQRILNDRYAPNSGHSDARIEPIGNDC